MDKWIKIEAFINKFLLFIIGQSKSIIAKITPQKVQDFTKRKFYKKKSRQKKESLPLKQKVVVLVLNFKILVEKVKAKLITLISNLKELISKVKSLDFKSLQLSTFKNYISKYTLPIWLKIKKFTSNLSTRTILGVVLIGLVIFLSLISIFNSSEKIKDKFSTPITMPTVEEVIKKTQKRSQFYKQADKILLITHVTIPVFIESFKRAETLIIDIKVKTSNMYIKSFFLGKDYLVKDIITSNIHPIVRDFPLEEEGKTIIKEKIKQELNNLLKINKIQGEILEVYIENLLLG
ncbi:MAG: hypothetical protein H6622_17955 [Halobacteriovoraceae bacterium]|nr:hypothetical protein [Halobacteriovoraceae bacterium]